MNDPPGILATGGAGYIGSHCCGALAAAGYFDAANAVLYRDFS